MRLQQPIHPFDVSRIDAKQPAGNGGVSAPAGRHVVPSRSRDHLVPG
jgi:hypothetical protein